MEHARGTSPYRVLASGSHPKCVIILKRHKYAHFPWAIFPTLLNCGSLGGRGTTRTFLAPARTAALLSSTAPICLQLFETCGNALSSSSSLCKTGRAKAQIKRPPRPPRHSLWYHKPGARATLQRPIKKLLTLGELYRPIWIPMAGGGGEGSTPIWNPRSSVNCPCTTQTPPVLCRWRSLVS